MRLSLVLPAALCLALALMTSPALLAQGASAPAPAPGAARPASATAANALPPRVVAPTDQAQFRRLVLPNGLRVLLASDPRFNRSAAALVVDVGQIDDPRDSEGLAHFLEHMLFLGTAKYPDEGEYGRFIQRNGGSQNAYTASDHTNYHFEVRHEALAGALDRFAQFFIAPSFNPAFVGREVTAVHNEAMRHLQNDGRRITSVKRELYDPQSGESKFSTGNRDTLARATPQAVRAFYEQHYSAHRMALSITGRAPLDELERLTREHFSAIPRRDVTSPVRVASFLPRKAALRLATVEPVRELRQLQLEFVLPATRPMFASRSATLVEQLVEHAGAGGLLARLREEGLANNLSAGLWERTPEYGSMFVSVDLTPQGEKAAPRVMELLFGYFEHLRRAPFPRAFFDDRARIGALQETYGNRGEGMRLATQLANQALFYPLEVAERAGTAWGAPDEASYRQLLDRMRPDNMLATLAARGVPTDRRERIYDVRYAYREDAGAAYTQLVSAQPHASFALPGANRFMPAATPLLAERAQTLIDEPGLALHYAPDTEFQRPQTAIVMRFVPARALADTEGSALLGLWSRAWRETIEADVADARAAGVDLGFDSTIEGLKLTLTGYGDSPARVARHVAERLRSLELSAARFEDLREQVLRSLASYAQSEAVDLARSRRDAMLREVAPLPPELEPVTRRATREQVQRFGERMLARGRLEVLVHGHLPPEEAVATARALARSIGARPLAAADRMQRRHLVMRAGEQVVDAAAIQGSNAVWWLDLALPEDTPRMRAASLAFAAFASPAVFTELRTRQQLGYIVSSGAGTSERARWLSFLIQSSTFTSSQLQQRAETFLATLPASLAALPDAEWAALKAGVQSRLEAKPTGIADRAERLFTSAYVFAGEWERQATTTAALQALTQADAARVLAEALDPATARRRTVRLDPTARPAEQPATPSFTDRDSWKRTREFR